MVEPFKRMARPLKVAGLGGQWGGFRLYAVDLEVAAGEYLVLVGPSGCGKTTFMELVCGLRKPGTGSILLGDRDITTVDPADRRVGYVPQDYELFPTMTVRGNLLFAPRVRRLRNTDTDQRFKGVTSMLRLERLLDRDVHTLSGGERQRVALGRALMTDPDLLLLDEPVSALPESLRDVVCSELYKLRGALNLTSIHVSHNLEEALLVADRIAVMNNGRIVQVGTSDEVLDQPVDPFVAEFTRCGNVWPVDMRGGKMYVDGDTIGRVDAPDGRYYATVRAESLRLDPAETNSIELTGRIVGSTRTPRGRFVKVNTGSLTVTTLSANMVGLDETVTVFVPKNKIWLIPRD